MTLKQQLKHRQRRGAAAGRHQSSLPADIMASRIGTALQLHQAGDMETAEAIYREVLRLHPGHADALHYLGMVLYQRRQFAEAADWMERSIAAADAQGGRAPFYSNYGLVLHDWGKLDHAAAAFARALKLRPDYPEALNNLGNTLQARGQLGDALVCYRRAIELQPAYARAYSNAGAVLKKLDCLAEAEEAYHTALRLDPRHMDAHYNLGNVLAAADLHEKAIVEYEAALLLDPDHQDALNNLAVSVEMTRSLAETVAWHRKVLERHPRHMRLRFNFGMLCLKIGDFAAGWAEYEARFEANGQVDPSRRSLPQWRGEPLNGRRIWLHPEQGLGDTLQFLRYAPLVQVAGGRVVLEVQPPLRRLAEQMTRHFGMELLQDGASAVDCDLQCPLLSLPLALGTRMDTIPARVPYLRPPAEELRAAEQLPWPANGLRVGLVWGGNPDQGRDRFRSMPLAALQTVLRVEGVLFYSLQVGPPAAQLQLLRDRGFAIGDLSPCPHNMADTAAKIAQLDLVLTVCTSVSHLAGALGALTWIMLAHTADWRWFLDPDACPWYPTVRLFRQPSRGDWHSVAERVAEELVVLRDRTALGHSRQRQWAAGTA